MAKKPSRFRWADPVCGLLKALGGLSAIGAIAIFFVAIGDEDQAASDVLAGIIGAVTVAGLLAFCGYALEVLIAIYDELAGEEQVPPA